MNYLIDTNICIYIMNQRPPEVIQKFKNHEIGQIAISSITVSELNYGVAKSQNKKQNAKRLEEFLTPFNILPYDEVASRYYGIIRSELESQGKVIGPLDMLIAAHAISEKLILVTNNEKEFQRIKSLKIENWAVQ
ncbi:type II toxin-antitoxin system VapC family toxin [uncultured Desulfobacter sp.]|uniref:type II toxin-antitoxin system tRNA(fMet)-specific endonuclease VapC n=1 Tax=uncultured Desulfobacter sp. TaxID=240139 RepID=UPI002AAB99D3|nr:type II toxin-antitoxin system VapC family toxin [uncultured Desulfobacter sp.]